MLLKDFYTVVSIEHNTRQKLVAKIRLNAAHEIFAAHFPGNPVTPGVCMMQIIKDLSEQQLGSDLFMNSLSTAKFVALVNPFLTPNLVFEIEIVEKGDNLFLVRNTTTFNETVALKLSCTYTKCS